MIQGFFFDLDGTLVNTYEADYLAYRDAFKEVLGLDVDREEFAKTHGEEMRHKFKTLDIQVNDEQSKQIAAVKKARYKTYIGLTEPNEQLIRFLADFADHHAMVLVTTAKRENALEVLKKHGLDGYFSHMVFGEDVENPKPHPEAYQLALKKAGLKPEQVVAFEDTETGIQAAEAAGIPVIYVRTFNEP